MIRELYTAQMEDLASHGYIVAALNHSYDGFLTIFPDGTSAAHDARRWPKVPSFEGEANLNQLQWHAGDLLTVLEYLSRGNQGHRQAGRLPDTWMFRAWARSAIRLAASPPLTPRKGISE